MSDILDLYLPYRRSLGLHDPLHVLLRTAWRRETASPAVWGEWTTDGPENGQNAVTCLFLAKRILGGSVAQLRLSDGTRCYVNWVPNGEDVSQRDYCDAIRDTRILGVAASYTKEMFVAAVAELDLVAREALLAERFLDVLRAEIRKTER